MTEKTPFQVLHLQKMHDEFGVDIEPAATLFGPELDAWISEAEDLLAAQLHAELREMRKVTG